MLSVILHISLKGKCSFQHKVFHGSSTKHEALGEANNLNSISYNVYGHD